MDVAVDRLLAKIGQLVILLDIANDENARLRAELAARDAGKKPA
jgi:hypothetical protein